MSFRLAALDSHIPKAWTGSKWGLVGFLPQRGPVPGWSADTLITLSITISVHTLPGET